MYACEPMHMHVHPCSHAGISFAKMTQFQSQKHIRIGVCEVQVEVKSHLPTFFHRPPLLSQTGNRTPRFGKKNAASSTVANCTYFSACTQEKGIVNKATCNVFSKDQSDFIHTLIPHVIHINTPILIPRATPWQG